MSEATEEKTTSKMHSRKFLVWIVASVLQVASTAYAFITEDSTLAVQMLPWWGGISMIYIGANAAQKFATPKAPETTQEA